MTGREGKVRSVGERTLLETHRGKFRSPFRRDSMVGGDGSSRDKRSSERVERGSLRFYSVPFGATTGVETCFGIQPQTRLKICVWLWGSGLSICYFSFIIPRGSARHAIHRASFVTDTRATSENTCVPINDVHLRCEILLLKLNEEIFVRRVSICRSLHRRHPLRGFKFERRNFGGSF